MKEEPITQFQQGYHALFMAHLDKVYEEAWKREEAKWAEFQPSIVFPDDQPRERPKFVPLSQQIAETEAGWNFLERQIRVIEEYERFFCRYVAWQK
jgi:hypothetical protein